MTPKNQNDPATIARFLKKQGWDDVDAAVILGSGLGDFTERITDAEVISYNEIPGMHGTSVAGHKGQLYRGVAGGKPIIAFAGRFHRYEGYHLDQTLLPVRIASEMGAKSILISNAAGGINLRFNVGDLMLIDDLLNPANVQFSISDSPEYFRYQPDHWIKKSYHVAAKLGINLQQGCYLYAMGPSYETPAEIRAFRSMGGDSVGMSTAPELIEAQRLGMDPFGISLITNKAAGITKAKLDHSEIKEAAEMRKNDFANLVEGLIA